MARIHRLTLSGLISVLASTGLNGPVVPMVLASTGLGGPVVPMAAEFMVALREVLAARHLGVCIDGGSRLEGRMRAVNSWRACTVPLPDRATGRPMSASSHGFAREIPGAAAAVSALADSPETMPAWIPALKDQDVETRLWTLDRIGPAASLRPVHRAIVRATRDTDPRMRILAHVSLRLHAADLPETWRATERALDDPVAAARVEAVETWADRYMKLSVLRREQFQPRLERALTDRARGTGRAR